MTLRLTSVQGNLSSDEKVTSDTDLAAIFYNQEKKKRVLSFFAYSRCCHLEGQKALESWGNVSLWSSLSSSE